MGDRVDAFVMRHHDDQVCRFLMTSFDRTPKSRVSRSFALARGRAMVVKGDKRISRRSAPRARDNPVTPKMYRVRLILRSPC